MSMRGLKRVFAATAAVTVLAGCSSSGLMRPDTQRSASPAADSTHVTTTTPCPANYGLQSAYTFTQQLQSTAQHVKDSASNAALAISGDISLVQQQSLTTGAATLDLTAGNGAVAHIVVNQKSISEVQAAINAYPDFSAQIVNGSGANPTDKRLEIRALNGQTLNVANNMASDYFALNQGDENQGVAGIRGDTGTPWGLAGLYNVAATENSTGATNLSIQYNSVRQQIDSLGQDGGVWPDGSPITAQSLGLNPSGGFLNSAIVQQRLDETAAALDGINSALHCTQGRVGFKVDMRP